MKLANRVDQAHQAAILGAVHARIPMVTTAEQRDLKLANAKQDEQFWSALEANWAAASEEHKELAAGAEKVAVDSGVRKTEAASRVAEAKTRIGRLEKGDDVPGGIKPTMTPEKMIAALGWKPSDVRNALRLAAMGEDAVEEIVQMMDKGRRRREKAASRAVFRRRTGRRDIE